MNIERIKKILAARNYFRTLPVYLCFLCSTQRHLIEKDVARWCEICHEDGGLFTSINWFMTNDKAFRNLIQHRLKNPSRSLKSWLHYFIARALWKPLDTLYINTLHIGGGLYIQHGFSTIISAKSIGENCRIYQQVTLGYKHTEQPVLEDYVTVTCGAKVLGGVTMHRNSMAGAGSVVVKDVPANAIVGGVPAKIIGWKDEADVDNQG